MHLIKLCRLYKAHVILKNTRVFFSFCNCLKFFDKILYANVKLRLNRP